MNIALLDMPLLDTRDSKDVLGTFIADLVLQLLLFIAQKERNAIRKRQAEGIAAAQARGVHLDRPRPKLTDEFVWLRGYWQTGEIRGSEAAQRCRIVVSTFLYGAKQFDPNNE